MKMKFVIALLFLLFFIFGLQLSCSPYAINIDKVIIERKTDSVSDKNLIH